MAENLNTLYYALGLDDHEMQDGLKKAIQNLSVLDDEFNRINKAIEETFGKKIKNAPIHNEIKGLKGELQALEKQWNALTLAERRGAEGQRIRAEYEALRKEAGNLNNSLARLYSESQKAASGQKGLAAQFGLVNKELTLQSRLMSNVNTLFTTYISIFAVKSFIQSLARVRGEFENQQIALRAILRDAEAADRLFGQIKSFAVVSPFEFKDLVGYAKQLSAFQVPVNELFDTTKRLADVSAGLGVGMDRIILAYGQVRSAAVLRGQELRQFTEAGIPLVDELAKKFSELEGRVVSAGDVFEKISNRMVSFEMVKEIFEDMTNEGGMFYMMQEKQAESLKGKIANLADAYDIMLNNIGKANDEILKGGVEGIAALFSNWEKVWKILKIIIAAYGSYKVAIMAVNAYESQRLKLQSSLVTVTTANTTAINTQTIALTKAKVASFAFNNALKSLGVAIKSNAIGLIASAIAALITAMIQLQGATNEARENALKFSAEISKSSKSVNELTNKLKDLASAGDDDISVQKERIKLLNQIRQIDSSVADGLEKHASNLKELIEIQEIYNKAASIAKNIEFFVGESEAGWFKEGLIQDFKDYENAINNLDAANRRLGQTEGKNLEIISRGLLENSDLREGELKQIKNIINSNDTYARKLIALQSIYKNAQKDYSSMQKEWRATQGFMNIMGSIDFSGLDAYIEKLKESNEATQEAKGEVKKLTDSLKNTAEFRGIDFNKPLSDATKLALEKSINDFLKTKENLSEQLKDFFKEQFYINLGVNIEPPESGGGNNDNVLASWKKKINEYIDKNPELIDFKLKGLPDENYSKSINDLANAYKNLTNERKLYTKGAGDIGVDKDKPENIDKATQAIRELFKALGLLNMLQEGGNNGKDPNAERLKEQIDLIKKAQAQYEKYLQIMSPDEALKAIRTDQQFMALDVQFEPDKVRERLQMVMNDIGKLPKSPELEKLKKSIQVAFTDIDYADAKKNFDQFLSDLTKELDTYKDKYNFYEQLLGITGDQNLAVNLAFNGDFEKAGKGIIEQIQQGMVEAASGTGLTLDQIMNLDFTKSAQDLGISEKLKGFLQKSVDEIGKINFSKALDVAKLVADYQSIQDKINIIIKNGAKEQEDIERNRAMLGDEFADQAIAASKKKTRQQVAALESESFKLTTFYQQLFGDISSYGNKSLDFLINKTESIINKLQTDDAKTQLKEKGVIDIEVDNQKLQLTESDVAKLTKRLGELNKEATGRNPFKELSTGISDYKKATDEVTKAQEKYDKATTDAEKSTAKLALEKAKFEQNNSFVKMFNSAAEAAGQLSNSIGGISDILGTLGVDMDGAGGAIVGGLQQTLSSLGSIDVTKPFSIITGAIGAVGGIFKSIFGSKDAKLDKKIKASEREVRRLQNAYSDLERAIDKSLGTDKYAYTSDQVKNLQKQQAEVARQAQLERDKKKTDKDKVADLERQYVELGHQIEDVLNNIRDEVIGSTADEIAQELGNAFFEAFAAGEDYAEAWGSKVKDIVADIVKRMLIDKLLDKKIGEVIDKYSKQWMDQEGNINTDKVISSSKDFYNELMGIRDGFASTIEALTQDPFFMELLGPDKSGKGLKEGIKGVTEDTAQLIASYMNAIRGSVLLQELYMKNIDTNVAGIYQAMGGSPNITTTTTIPPEIIAAISEPFKLNNTLLASIDANMANVHSISANALAQLVMIQANTYNTAMEVKRCADYFESVIMPGHPKGRSGINVFA